jgi:hypothetical protein
LTFQNCHPERGRRGDRVEGPAFLARPSTLILPDRFEAEGAFPAGISITRSRVMMIGLLVLWTSSMISRHLRQNSTSGILFGRIFTS